MASPYDILDIDSDADSEAIKAAYRSRVKETHPDLGGSQEAFKRVERAYERLSEADADERVDHADVVADEDPDDEPAHVEYLNYEVLDDYGWALEDDETLLEAAERNGFAWPYACRGGACANCAVSVCEGELSQLVDHILSSDFLDQGIRLSCNGAPTTDSMQVVYNLKQRQDLDDLRLPPDRFEKAHARK